MMNKGLIQGNLVLFPAGTSGRDSSECIPAKLESGKRYPFFREAYNTHPIGVEIPLCRPGGNGCPINLATIIILEETTFLCATEGVVHTRGTYKVTYIPDSIK